jgi:hypothetical protein
MTPIDFGGGMFIDVAGLFARAAVEMGYDVGVVACMAAPEFKLANTYRPVSITGVIMVTPNRHDTVVRAKVLGKNESFGQRNGFHAQTIPPHRVRVRRNGSKVLVAVFSPLVAPATFREAKYGESPVG